MSIQNLASGFIRLTSDDAGHFCFLLAFFKLSSTSFCVFAFFALRLSVFAAVIIYFHSQVNKHSYFLLLSSSASSICFVF